MSVTYSTNWMGPINKSWYEERNLVQDGEITTHYSAGRIDIRDDSKEGYDGWDEYGLVPMHGEDWNALSDWLETLDTDRVLHYTELLERFEEYYGKKIRWWKE